MQVTIQGVQLYDSVHWAVHILRSEAVAVMGVSIWGDPLVPLSRGIVIDGSRRVYLGGNVISTADDAVSLKTTAGARSLSCTDHYSFPSAVQGVRDALPHAILLCADFQQWSYHLRPTGLLPWLSRFPAWSLVLYT